MLVMYRTVSFGPFMETGTEKTWLMLSITIILFSEGKANVIIHDCKMLNVLVFQQAVIYVM